MAKSLRVAGFLVVIFVLMLCIGARADLSTNTVAIKAARMFDGKGKGLLTNGIVIVQGDKIVDVGSNLVVPAGARVIDLGDVTLSPGFMDAHTHLTADFTGNFNERRLKALTANVSELAFMAIPNARATLDAGFTTVRDLGSRFQGSHDFVDIAMRNVIAKGIILGPRMLVATCGIGATGGHFDDTAGYRDILFGSRTRLHRRDRGWPG